MNDPRETPGFKAKHPTEKAVALLGAILDALKALAPSPPAVPAPPAVPRRQSKQD